MLKKILYTAVACADWDDLFRYGLYLSLRWKDGPAPISADETEPGANFG